MSKNEAYMASLPFFPTVLTFGSLLTYFKPTWNQTSKVLIAHLAICQSEVQFLLSDLA